MSNHFAEINTPGNKIYSGLNKLSSNLIIKKTTPDAFYNTKLKNYLTENILKTLYIIV